MPLRSLLLGAAAAALLAGTAAAQTGSFTTGGSGTGSLSAGGTGTGTGATTGAGPTQLLPQAGVGGGDVQRSLSGLPQQGGSEGALDDAGSSVSSLGADTGPIATTPSPLNASPFGSGSGGPVVLTPTPRNAPVIGSTAVPPMFGTGVPPVSGDTGLGIPLEGLGTGAGAQGGLVRGGFVRSDGQILSASQVARLQRQSRAQQNQAGAQVIILSGSVFQGTTDRPNVVVVPTGQGTAGQGRGLTAQTLRRGQPVLQGTVEAPRVIALAPSSGNVLVVQGSQFAETGASGTGQIRAQIVELPAE